MISIRTIGLGVLLLSSLMASGARLEISPDSGVAGHVVSLDVGAVDAETIGRYEISLRYNPSVLEIVSIRPGATIGGDLIDSAESEAGELWVGGTISAPQSEHRPLLTIRARVLGTPGQTTGLDLSRSRAWQVSGGPQIELETTHADLVVRRAFLPFGLTAWQLLGMLTLAGLLAGVYYLSQKKPPRPDWEVAPPPQAPPMVDESSDPDEEPTEPGAIPPVAIPPIAIPDGDEDEKKRSLDTICFGPRAFEDCGAQ